MAYSEADSASLLAIRSPFMTLFNGPAPCPRHAEESALAHMLVMVAATLHRRERRCAGRLFAVADLGGAACQRPVAVAGQRRRTLFNVPTAAIRRKSSATPGRRSGSISVSSSLAGTAGCAEACQRRYNRGEGAAIDRIFLSISAHRDTLAPDTRVRTIYPRYLEQATTPVDDGLTMRAFRDGSPYANEDLFSADDAEPQCALHARRPDARHVPERAPRRRRRPDVPLSAELAVAMARRRECDGSLDGADARAEGLGRSIRGWAKALAPCPPSHSHPIERVVGTLVALPTLRHYALWRCRLTRRRPDLPRGSPSGTGTSDRRPRHRRTARR